MNEVKDTNQIEAVEAKQYPYKEIKPKTRITIEQIKEFWDNKFSNIESVSDESKDVNQVEDVEDSYEDYSKNCPVENGSWDGERGDSKWVPESEYIPQKNNSEQKTWGEILKAYNIDGITYNKGEPDLSEVSKGNVKIESFSSSRTDNFDQADIKMAERRGCSPQEVKTWRTDNGYTWHECKDMETLQKVPQIVHNNISHRGGIAEVKEEDINQ